MRKTRGQVVGIEKTEELSTEELLFAARHNLPLFADQYSKTERIMLKRKAHEEIIQKSIGIENRKRKVLFGL